MTMQNFYDLLKSDESISARAYQELTELQYDVVVECKRQPWPQWA